MSRRTDRADGERRDGIGTNGDGTGGGLQRSGSCLDESPRESGVVRVARLLAALYPWPVDASDDLRRALSFLGTPLGADTVVRAGYGGAAVVLAVTVPLATLAGLPLLVAATAGFAGALGAAHAAHSLPQFAARLRRTSALGEAPDLVGRAVLRMRVRPTPESAARFAAETGTGPLAASLLAHVRRARGRGDAGFGTFAAEWADWFPALRRAVLLLAAADEAPPDERDRTLDRALDAVLDGTRDRMAAFASDIQGPATGLYAFGVLLPLAVAAVVPAARVAGLPVSLLAVVAFYDLLLPAGLVVAAGWLLSRRPVAFRPPTVPPDHPDVPDHRRGVLLVAALAGGFAWFGARFVLPWAGPVAGVGTAAGVGLFGWFRPEKRVRDRTVAVESGLSDALYLVGRRVDDGTAVEAAVSRAADEVGGPTGDVLAEAARRQRQLRVGVREAFLGERGPLADLPSPRARSSVAMLALAAREGRPAGTAAVALADHLEELRSVEREARSALGRVTDTLGTTAAVFAPLVGGVTVALSGSMGAVSGAEPLPTAGLGRAVGAYVLLLAVLLTALSVGLDRGLDRALVGYRCGAALLAATAVYLAAVVAAGVVV